VDGPAAVVVNPAGTPPVDEDDAGAGTSNTYGTAALANTGASALLPAAGAAGAAIVAGGILMVLVRHRRQRTRD
jgi:streptogrisin C